MNLMIIDDQYNEKNGYSHGHCTYDDDHDDEDKASRTRMMAIAVVRRGEAR